MRNGIFTTACACVLLGCGTPPKDGKKSPPQPPPTVMPLTPIIGKVLAVNTALKFVAVDFSLSRRPTPGDVYSVFRAGQKVGEVRISDVSSLANFAADITAGEAQIGDEVRKD